MRLAVVLGLVLLVTACSDDEPVEPRADHALSCEETGDQEVAARFKSTDPAAPDFGGLLTRFFDENRQPCASVASELPKGWAFDHYTVEYETAFFHGSLTKKRYDGPDPFLRAYTASCAEFSAEYVIHRGDRVVTYTAKTKGGPRCTPADPADD